MSSDDKAFRVSLGEEPEEQEQEVEQAVDLDSLPEKQEAPAPEEDDWRSSVVPDVEQFYGRARGKTLGEVDQILRSLEAERREAQTARANLERELAAKQTALEYIQQQRIQPQAAPAPQAPQVPPTLDVLEDMLEGRGQNVSKKLSDFIDQKIEAGVQARIASQLESVRTEVRGEVEGRFSSQRAGERLRSITGQVFTKNNIPESDFRDTYDELVRKVEALGDLYDPENWQLAMDARRLEVSKRYGLNGQAPAPVTAPKPPAGNFDSPQNGKVFKGKPVISQADRDKFTEVGQNAFGLEGDELEDYIRACSLNKAKNSRRNLIDPN